jgi:tetratricopeptide (TPR) repeat protein
LKPKYLITICSAIALIALLFFFGNTVEKGHKPAAMPSAGGPMQQGQMPAVAPADFDSLLAAAKMKLSPKDQASIMAEENSVTRGDVKAQQIRAYENLGKLWMDRNRAIAAYYFAKSGELENSEKKLTFAAHLLSEGMQDEQNAAVRQWMANEAIESYNQALNINPGNDTIRVDLALMYVNGSGQPMKGIQLLLAMVQKDSTNIPANVILGKLAVESGQLDKAIERGNKILSFDKNNWQAYLFMGEAYKRKGNKTKAIELFNEAKKIKSDSSFNEDIDKYIKSFQ